MRKIKTKLKKEAKEENTRVKINWVGLFFVLAVFIFEIILAFDVYGQSYATYQPTLFSSSTDFQYSQPSFQSFYSSQGVDYKTFWPILADSDKCEARSDFIVNIRPGGCMPMVVRSDLLEEQNVPVFCKLDAVKLNPIISVAAMKSVTFKGEYPKEIAGVSFHPSDAALRMYTTKLDSPILNDVGYVVVALKRTEKEKDMPEFVEANLTAVLQYDMEKAIGVGFTSLFVPQLSDSEWARSYQDYSFWRGRGYIRLESLSKDNARISIYTDASNQISSVELEKGKTSNTIYMPGFYCKAGIQINLKDVTYPKKSAKLNVDGNEVWVTEGSSVLSRCNVKTIEKSLGGSVVLSCPQGLVTLTLSSLSRVKLGNAEYDVGDKVDSANNIYLAYAGKQKFNVGDVAGKTETKSFVVFVKNPSRVENDKLKVENLVSLAGEIENIFSRNTDEKEDARKKEIISAAKSEFGGEADISFRGEPVENNKIQIGFNEQTGVVDKDCLEVINNEENCKRIEEYFAATRKEAENIARFYGSEKPNDNSEPYGATALNDAAKLAGDLKKQATKIEILKEIASYYPNSKAAENALKEISNLEEYNYENSGTSIRIGYENHYIDLVDVKTPSRDDASAEFEIQNENSEKKPETLIIGDYLYNKDISTAKSEYVKLIDLDDSKAVVEYHVESKTEDKSGTGTFTKELMAGDILPALIDGKRVRLIKVNLKRVAEINLIPQNPDITSEANFSVRIGIEKRAIQLTPEKTKARIDSLNASIQKWEKIVANLGNLVKGWKGACFATSAVLFVKNFISNLGGKSMARNIVMRGKGGYYEKCTKEKAETGISYDECYAKYSDNIANDIDETEKRIEAVNNQVESSYVYGKKDLFGNTVNSQNSTQNFASGPFLDFIKSHANEQINITGKMTPLMGNEGVFQDEATVQKMAADGKLSMEDMRNIMLYGSLSNEKLKSSSLSAILKPINDKKFESKTEAEYQTALEKLSSDAGITFTETGTRVSSKVFTLGKDNILNIKPGEYVLLGIDEDKRIVKKEALGGLLNQDKTLTSSLLLIPVISKSGDNYGFDGSQTYSVIKEGDSWKITETIDKDITSKILGNMKIGSFQKISRGMCMNKYINPAVKFFEREPYKGRPALVPVDLNNGWYAAVKQNLAGVLSSGIAPYTSAGQVESFWLCNVGSNGIEEFENNLNDDICTQINTFTGQSFSTLPCVEPNEADRLVKKAISLISEAASQYGNKKVRLTGVGEFPSKAAGEQEGTQCQDFMSPEDCVTLFNVCDPVICPPSRCDLGGAYRVDDVIQSGIIGSIALCLPNFGMPSEGGVLVPVCLSGIQAGLDAFVSIMKSHRDCLQENLKSGKMIGICDEIYSIYLCEFFWKQAAPLMEQAIPKLIESLYYGKQGIRGGGEYLTVQDAWNTMQKSTDYFTNYYGLNAFKAFRAGSTGEVGTEICKAFVSTRFPNNKDMLDKLLEPESPVQFYARFDEIAFSDATVPATSQYKVYYHIYGGKESGHYYSVYLKNPPQSGYYASQPYITVDSGYVGISQSIDIAKDFTAPKGYKELCVRIDTNEKCGFQTVSTSFAVNYVKDSYVAEQAGGEINSEKQCVSGNPSLLGLANPNVQAGVENTIQAGLYNTGVIRICSTNDPGQNTNPGKWQIVGFCDTNKKVLCWTDTESVKNAIKNLNIENQTLEEIKAKSGEISSEISGKTGIWTTATTSGKFEEVQKKLQDFKSELDLGGKKQFTDFQTIGTSAFDATGYGQIVSKLNEIEQHAYGNNEKVKAAFMRFGVYRDLTRKMFEVSQKAVAQPVTPATTTTKPATSTTTTAEQKTQSVQASGQFIDTDKCDQCGIPILKTGCRSDGCHQLGAKEGCYFVASKLGIINDCYFCSDIEKCSDITDGLTCIDIQNNCKKVKCKWEDNKCQDRTTTPTPVQPSSGSDVANDYTTGKIKDYHVVIMLKELDVSKREKFLDDFMSVFGKNKDSKLVETYRNGLVNSVSGGTFDAASDFGKKYAENVVFARTAPKEKIVSMDDALSSNILVSINQGYDLGWKSGFIYGYKKYIQTIDTGRTEQDLYNEAERFYEAVRASTGKK